MNIRVLLHRISKYRWLLLLDIAVVNWALATHATFWRGLIVGCVAGLVAFAVDHRGEKSHDR